MGNFRISKLYHTLITCTVSSSLLASALVNPTCMACEKGFNITPNDIAFIAKLEKLYEKAKKYIDRLEYDKLIDVMLDVKIEIEQYTGIEIDIEENIDAFVKEAKKNGVALKKEQVRQVKKYIKKKNKKHSHKTVFMYECNLQGIDFDQTECDLHFDAMCKKKEPGTYTNGKKEKDKDKEIYVPIRVSVGITAGLVAYFLRFIPHPYTQQASAFLMAISVELCVEGMLSNAEEKEDQD